MRLIRLVLLPLLALFATLALAADFLEPEQAFRLSARAAGPDTIELRFEIAEGYYLYRERLSAEIGRAHV